MSHEHSQYTWVKIDLILILCHLNSTDNTEIKRKGSSVAYIGQHWNIKRYRINQATENKVGWTFDILVPNPCQIWEIYLKHRKKIHFNVPIVQATRWWVHHVLAPCLIKYHVRYGKYAWITGKKYILMCLESRQPVDECTTYSHPAL